MEKIRQIPSEKMEEMKKRSRTERFLFKGQGDDRLIAGAITPCEPTLETVLILLKKGYKTIWREGRTGIKFPEPIPVPPKVVKEEPTDEELIREWIENHF